MEEKGNPGDMYVHVQVKQQVGHDGQAPINNKLRFSQRDMKGVQLSSSFEVTTRLPELEQVEKLAFKSSKFYHFELVNLKNQIIISNS